MAVRKRRVRWRRSQPRMQSTRRPLPSALPVAKVKGSGSSRRLRPLRLHLLSLCVSRACHPRDHHPTPPGQQTLLTATGPAPTSAGPRCTSGSGTALPRRSAQHATMVVFSLSLRERQIRPDHGRCSLTSQIPQPCNPPPLNPPSPHPSPRGGVQSRARCRLPAPPPSSGPP